MPGAPKKIVDTWKLKKWYTVIAPNFLNNAEAAEVPAVDDASLLNRIIQLPLKEITRDISHSYTSIRLRITEIKGRKAFAKFIGHSIAREFLRTLVRRRRTPVDVVLPLVSKDGVEFKAKVMGVAAGDCSRQQKKALRRATASFFSKKASALDFGEFVRAVLFGRMSMELFDELKQFFPISRVEIWKTELKEVFDVAEVMELEKSDEQKMFEAEKAGEQAGAGQESEAPAGEGGIESEGVESGAPAEETAPESEEAAESEEETEVPQQPQPAAA